MKIYPYDQWKPPPGNSGKHFGKSIDVRFAGIEVEL